MRCSIRMSLVRGALSRFVAVLACASCALAIAQCDRVDGVSPKKGRVRLTSGFPGAFFHPFGAALVDIYSRAMPDLSFEVVPSGGALENLEFLQEGAAELGLTFADITYQAYVGRLDEKPVPFDRLRGVAVLQATAVHVMVRPGSGIQSIGEMRGRRVALGPDGSGTAATAKILLEAFGVSTGDVRAEYLPFMDAANRLVRGDLDATFVSAGYPVESVLSATRAGAQLLQVSGPVVEELRNSYPFLKAVTIPADTYPALSGPLFTVGIDAVVACSAQLHEETAYRLTKTLLEALPELATRVDALRHTDLARAPATPIPLHDGAARYYRERELFR